RGDRNPLHRRDRWRTAVGASGRDPPPARSRASRRGDRTPPDRRERGGDQSHAAADRGRSGARDSRGDVRWTARGLGRVRRGSDNLRLEIADRPGPVQWTRRTWRVWTARPALRPVDEYESENPCGNFQTGPLREWWRGQGDSRGAW